ncbi:MAG: 50S ribosomal protein L10 [bacterium]
MSKAEKQKFITDLETELKENPNIIITSFQGLNVDELDGLRKQLRPSKSKYKVIKNRLTKKVIKNLAISDFSQYFDGPTGLVIERGDPVNASKIIVNFSKVNDKLKIKAALLDGKLIDKSKVIELSKTPSKNVLIAQFAQTLVGPLTGLIFVLQANLQELAGVITALKESKEKN